MTRGGILLLLVLAGCGEPGFSRAEVAGAFTPIEPPAAGGRWVSLPIGPLLQSEELLHPVWVEQRAVLADHGVVLPDLQPPPVHSDPLGDDLDRLQAGLAHLQQTIAASAAQGSGPWAGDIGLARELASLRERLTTVHDSAQATPASELVAARRAAVWADLAPASRRLAVGATVLISHPVLQAARKQGRWREPLAELLPQLRHRAEEFLAATRATDLAAWVTSRHALVRSLAVCRSHPAIVDLQSSGPPADRLALRRALVALQDRADAVEQIWTAVQRSLREAPVDQALLIWEPPRSIE